jgi:hypothetical protein
LLPDDDDDEPDVALCEDDPEPLFELEEVPEWLPEPLDDFDDELVPDDVFDEPVCAAQEAADTATTSEAKASGSEIAPRCIAELS